MTAQSSRLEGLLRKDNAIVIAALVALTVVAWAYLVVLSLEMSEGDMRLMGMGIMGDMGGESAMSVSPQPWTPITFLLMLLMWWVMMVGMMVPSAAPMILLYAAIQRKKLSDENPVLRTGLFTLGYLLSWLAFSLVATSLQWYLGRMALLSPTMVSTSAYLTAAIFAVAGLYQLTPLKRSCLANCSSPIRYLSTHWRNGNSGGLLMGVQHGTYCVGCCWCLMGLLFIGGIMNLLWVAVIAIAVLLEKVLPNSRLIVRVTGAIMLAFSIYILSASPLWI
jgi:predicted metal-binding membrane protein